MISFPFLNLTVVSESLDDVKEVSHKIAIAVAKQAIEDGVAEPTDVELAINRIKWVPKYYPFIKV